MNSFMRQNSIPADEMHNFLKDKCAWENAISMYQGQDHLDHWYNYICWYENHRHGDPENQFRQTLERCLAIFEHSDYYKQDMRMVRLWLKYIDMQPNPLHFYQVLHTRGVGRQVAAFYISWANYYESVNALKEAEAVYNVAFKEKAQSYAELHHAHSKFLYAHSAATPTVAPTVVPTVSPVVYKPIQNIHEQQQHQQQIRYNQQQQQQQTHQTTEIQQTAYVQSTVHRQQLHQIEHAQQHAHPHPSHSQISSNYRQQSIYQHQQTHIQHQLQAQQQQQQSQSVALQQQHPQNVYHQVAAPAANFQHQPQQQQLRLNGVDGQQAMYLQQQQQLPQTLTPPISTPAEQQLPATNHHIASQIGSQIQYTQQQQQQPEVREYPKCEPLGSAPAPVTTKQHVQKEAVSNLPGIKLPKKFASYSRNNYETWKPALFLEEPDDPCRQCHYQKRLVYPPGSETEYSPEEILARGYLKHSEPKHKQETEKVEREGNENINTIKTEAQSHHKEQIQERNFYQVSTYDEVQTQFYAGSNNSYQVVGQNGLSTSQTEEEEEEEEEEDEDDEEEGEDGEEEEEEEEEDYDDQEDETDQVTNNQQQFAMGSTVDDLEERIEASTIRFSMHSDKQGLQNKTIKIKFKKEPPTPNGASNKTQNGNYSAYTVVQSHQSAVNSPEVRRNGHSHSFHPYMMNQTSTPKARHHHHHHHHHHNRSKLKKISNNKLQVANGSSSNSSSADNGVNIPNGYSTATGVVIAGGFENSLHNATFNDNANYSFSSAAALDNSNCSLTSAVDRLNFRDTTFGGVVGGGGAGAGNNNTSKLNSTNVADFSTYQENSYFATQHDTEAKERRLQKALATIAIHFEKAAIDPFNSELCRAFLTKVDFPNMAVNSSNCKDPMRNLKIVQTPLPKLANTRVLSLPETGNVQYNIDKEVGRGSYGSVYKATDANSGSVVALKYQKPPNTWEIYICDQVLKRIKSPNVLPGLMDISSAIIAPNASLIATEFSPFGSLLDINNKIRQATTKVMHESLVMHFSAQICNIVNHLHKQKIIHADIKPDNFLLMRVPSTDLHFPSLRLIDFGCAIDMTLFPDPDKTKFRKVIQTDGFTCVEMQEGRPWSYETDIFCIAGTVHVMLFGEYMQLQKRTGIWDIKQKLPRYLKKHVWGRFFGETLNIKSNKLPDLQEFHAIFDEESRKMDSELQKQIRTLSNILFRR